MIKEEPEFGGRGRVVLEAWPRAVNHMLPDGDFAGRGDGDMCALGGELVQLRVGNTNAFKRLASIRTA